LHKQSSVAPAQELSLSVAQPLLIDIRAAAAMLGVSVFAVRNLCWTADTKRVLKPIRHGLKLLFSPAALNDFAAKLVSGELQFPPTPTKVRKRRAVAG
jgi:hypothetical protein